MATRSYTYKPLSTKIPHIRLISNISREANDNFRIDLKHHELGTVPYHALSYTWGSPQPLYDVSIGNEFVSVRQNVHSFFNHCLDVGKWRETRIWIDSICINQDDLDEKSRQIQLMGQIFHRADQVLIWLDKASEIDTVTRQYRQHDSMKQTDALEFWIWLVDKASNEQVSELSKVCTDCINDIFTHTYWSRLWIVQEIMLSTRTVVILGTFDVELSEMLHDFFKAQGPFHTLFDSLCTNAQTRALGFLDLRKVQYPLWQLMQTFCEQGCTEPRDRIYGLLGMSSISEQFTIDYRESLPALFLRSLKMFFTEEHCESWEFEGLYPWATLDLVAYLLQALKIDSSQIWNASVSDPLGHELVQCSFSITFQPQAKHHFTPVSAHETEDESMSFIIPNTSRPFTGLQGMISSCTEQSCHKPDTTHLLRLGIGVLPMFFLIEPQPPNTINILCFAWQGRRGLYVSSIEPECAQNLVSRMLALGTDWRNVLAHERAPSFTLPTSAYELAYLSEVMHELLSTIRME